MVIVIECHRYWPFYSVYLSNKAKHFWPTGDHCIGKFHNTVSANIIHTLYALYANIIHTQCMQISYMHIVCKYRTYTLYGNIIHTCTHCMEISYIHIHTIHIVCKYRTYTLNGNIIHTHCMEISYIHIVCEYHTYTLYVHVPNDMLCYWKSSLPGLGPHAIYI